MFLNKIKQNLAGFAAVVVAAAGFTAIAPANAVATTADVTWTSVNRMNSTISNNTITVAATVGANETFQNVSSWVRLGDSSNNLAIQVGDIIRATGTYTNITDGSTASSINTNCVNISALSGVSWSYPNSCNTAFGANNVVVSDTTLSLAAGNYSSFTVSNNFNLSDSAISANDQLQFSVSYKLVRGGVETALPIRTAVTSDSSASFYFVKTTTDRSHVVGATDTTINTNSDFCVYRGENGVTNNTQIEITVTNSGTGNSISSVGGSGWVYGGGTSLTPSINGNIRTYTAPANGWDVLQFSVYATVGSPTVGQTFTPVLSAVISGTSTSVIDTCKRAVNGFAAPTVTANANDVTVSWGSAPSLPVAGSWDTIRVLACETTLATCGQYVPTMGMYNPSAVRVQSYNLRSSGVIAGNATSYTAATNNMTFQMTAPGQTPTTWSAGTSYKYFVVYEDMQSPYYAVSALSTAVSAGAQQQVQQQNVAPTLPTTVPLVAPIAVPPTGIKPGGALVLSGANMASVTSIKVGASTATTVKTANGLEIKVPADLAPGAHDLLVTTSTGATLFVGAIKVADPVVEAAKVAQAKAAASIAYRAPIDLTVGKTVSSSQAAAAKKFAAQYRDAKTAICVAIPATKATSAAALAAAAKVCATFKAQIPGIKTSIVLGTPSGDKVNRVSAEVQG